jgi:DNA invertase Pin-like site-specific DNA recombinase
MTLRPRNLPMTAFGYIRKSVVHDAARMLSPETQEAAIRDLAARNGDDDVTILSDLDISGKKRRDKRPGWDELLRAVETGEAHAVYAYSLSRFARSVSQLAEFFDLCDRLKVAVRVDRDHIDTSSATGKLVSNVLASLAQFESDVASERVKDAFAVKRRNDPAWQGPGAREYGSLPGEDTGIVVEAFHAAGSFDGAARILNERRVACRSSRAVWHGTTVRDIVRRAFPDEVAPSQGRGAKAGPRPFRLARLIACGTCGTLLTPSQDKRTGVVRYYCHRAKVTPHARGWVTESLILPAIRDEAEHAAVAIRRMQVGTPQDEARAADLAAKRDRILANFEDGLIDRGARDAKLAVVAEAESKLSSRRWVKRIRIAPDIEADDPARVNDHLRRLFDRATVDMSEPARKGPSKWVPTVEFAWRDPSMRYESSDDDGDLTVSEALA